MSLLLDYVEEERFCYSLY